MRFVSPIIEVRAIDGKNYEEVIEWCGGMVIDNADTSVTVYFSTYHPEYKVNNRMDFVKGASYDKVYREYIAKMENGSFISFESLHLDAALEPLS
jgi:hypothetical protein